MADFTLGQVYSGQTYLSWEVKVSPQKCWSNRPLTDSWSFRHKSNAGLIRVKKAGGQAPEITLLGIKAAVLLSQG